MKILKRCIIALAIALTMLATAQAETDLSKLSKLTPYDGKAAIEAIDSMGFEVIPRSELEEVRGEGFGEEVMGAMMSATIAAHIGPKALAITAWEINKAVFGGAYTLAKYGWSAFGWEVGRTLAINEGLPDPGSWHRADNHSNYIAPKWMKTVADKATSIAYKNYK